MAKCLVAGYMSEDEPKVTFEHKDTYTAHQAPSCPIGGQHSPLLYLAMLLRQHFLFELAFDPFAYWCAFEVRQRVWRRAHVFRANRCGFGCWQMHHGRDPSEEYLCSVMLNEDDGRTNQLQKVHAEEGPLVRPK